MLVHIWCAPTWRFHTELCKFLRNISTNICGLGKRTDLKLGEVSSLFSSNKITISWLYPLNGFRFIFFLRDSENDLLIFASKQLQVSLAVSLDSFQFLRSPENFAFLMSLYVLLIFFLTEGVDPKNRSIFVLDISLGRRDGLMVRALVSGSSDPGSSHGRGHCDVYLGKTPYSHSASLHPAINGYRRT